MPAQLGPTKPIFLSLEYLLMYLLILTISCDGIPSVIATQDLIPASAASIAESAAKAGGTKIIEALAPVSLTASSTESNTGTEMFIASGLENDVLTRIISGEIIGTKFLSKQSLNESRKRWLITGYSSSKGDITLDEGAIKAIKNKGSVLPPGIKNTSGDFDRGDIIGIKNSIDKVIGWGIYNYSSKEISKIKGINSSKIIDIVEKNYGSEVIHRNNLVLTQ